jgi:hypothetical protein
VLQPNDCDVCPEGRHAEYLCNDCRIALCGAHSECPECGSDSLTPKTTHREDTRRCYASGF